MCPGSIHWLGYIYNGKFYFDVTLSMGSRSSARCCQMVTSAVVFIYTNKGFFAINYLDDLGSAELTHKAEEAFEELRQLLVQIGLKEAVEKTVPPCTVMVFLGIEVNSITLTLSIPLDKWNEIQGLLKTWIGKKSTNLKEVQQLAGLLNFACCCVKSGRVYLARILNFLRSLPKKGSRKIPVSVLHDVQWWIDFAPKFNSTSLLTYNWWSRVDTDITTDSCLTGAGAFNKITGEFFHWKFPEILLELSLDINQLECLTVVLALKLWGASLNRKRMQVHCDNQVSVEWINSGTSRNTVIQACLRKLHVQLALNSCELRAVFLTRKKNGISDELSCWHLNDKFHAQFYQLTSHFVCKKECVIEDEMWRFVLDSRL